MSRKQMKITVSFKETEVELYRKIKDSSCCPSMYVKDILMKYFAAMDINKKSD